MLLWDGGLIKVMLVRAGPGGATRACHDGAIEVLQHDAASNTIISGGADGFIRLWDFQRIMDAEAPEDSHTLAISPLDEVLIGEGE